MQGWRVEHQKKPVMVPAFPKLALHGKTEEATQVADRMPTQMNDLTEGQRSMGKSGGKIKVI